MIFHILFSISKCCLQKLLGIMLSIKCYLLIHPFSILKVNNFTTNYFSIMKIKAHIPKLLRKIYFLCAKYVGICINKCIKS